MGSLIIAYAEPGKRPLSVATISDRELLQHAARVALDEAERRVSTADNSVVAQLQAAEVRRLRTALQILVPGAI
jgi:gentisate 1,2-dioxygenase